MIRPATINDAADFLEIYSPFILHSGITQETEKPSLDEFTNRVASVLAERPWLAAEVNGKIAGYAYAARHRERKGYQWCIEPSVYLHKGFYGKNIANALYTALVDLLKRQGYINAYAVITLPNKNSVNFHEKFGFSYITTFKKIAYKLGQWHDTGWWHYQLNNDEPSQLIPFPSLDKETVDEVCKKASTLIRL